MQHHAARTRNRSRGASTIAASMFGRMLLALGCAIAAIAALSPASAQGWPQRSITFIVSQAAGSSPDVMARLLADRLSKSLGQGVVIENKPGGANVVGATAGARAAPDGYTYFFATSAALSTNPFMIKSLGYDPVKDFSPVTLITRSHQLIVVHPDVPVKTMAELIATDKAAPGKYSVGVDSPRSLAGVTAQAINKIAGMTMVLVPYPNINSALQDAVAGRIQVGVFSESVVGALVGEGKLRAIAIASGRRSKLFPDLALVADTLPGFDFSGWFMLMAPAGTPKEIIDKLGGEVAEAAKDAKLVEMAPKLGFEMEVNGPTAAAQFLKSQLDLWGRITKDLGIEPQ